MLIKDPINVYKMADIEHLVVGERRATGYVVHDSCICKQFGFWIAILL